MNARIQMVGRRFGRLVVVSERPYVQPNGRKRLRWLCRCDCGTEATVDGNHLRAGRIQSCGCIVVDTNVARSTHGDTRGDYVPAEHSTWAMMINRCTNPRASDYRHYGGRGIKVCDRWLYGTCTKTAYECFLIDMGRKPTLKHTLDRIDNDGNYEPTNCRWATWTEQRRNQRRTKK